jgi:hypothetical protein
MVADGPATSAERARVGSAGLARRASAPEVHAPMAVPEPGAVVLGPG